MKGRMVRIGNSRGIRIPKSVIEQCHLYGAVDLEIQRGNWSFAQQPSRAPGGTKPSRRCIATGTTA